MISHIYFQLCSYSLSLIHTTSIELHFHCPFLCPPTSPSFRMESHLTLLHPPTSSLSDKDLMERPVGCQRGILSMFCWIWILRAGSLQAVGVHIPTIGRPALLCSLTDFILYYCFFPFHFSSQLFATLVLIFLYPVSSQVKSLRLITLSPLLSALLHLYPNLVFLKPLPKQSCEKY